MMCKLDLMEFAWNHLLDEKNLMQGHVVYSAVYIILKET